MISKIMYIKSKQAKNTYISVLMPVIERKK
uniref:Uncharacterized protein n=1 Tax=virus sp. cti5L29 TaxID=2826813 RepID=A0A8S5R983_9VIRU|nr:MAG TPA: hypothetical protein [virus sp. cti5L29]